MIEKPASPSSPSAFSLRFVVAAVIRPRGHLRLACYTAGLFLLAASTVIMPSATRAQTAALPLSHPAAASSLTGRAAADRPLSIQISFALRNPAKLSALLAHQQDPSSPQYHKWLTPAQFDRRFGRTADEVHAVSQWLKDEGFSVTLESVRGITANATASVVEASFHTTIAASPDDTVYANLTDPVIPAQFAAIIGAIGGLDNTRHSTPMLSMALRPVFSITSADLAMSAALANAMPGFAGGDGTAFGPADFRTFYDETPLISNNINGGGGDCIAVIEDSNYLASAVTLFDSTFALPAASITNVFPTTNPSTNGDEIEVLLDIEWGHAVAPGAAIRVYIGSGGNALPDATD